MSAQNDVAYYAAQWRAAQEAVLVERAHLMQAIQEASEAGVGERTLAEWAGVSRGTVREWLGR